MNKLARPLLIVWIIILVLFLAALAKEKTDYFSCGFAKYENGDFDRAIADYTSVIANDPKNAAAYFNRGLAKHDKGDLEGAIADYSRVIEFDSKDDDAYNCRGDVHMLLRNWQAALTDYRRACELNDKGNDYTHLVIWLIRARLNEREAADQELADFLHKRPQATFDDWVSTVGEFLLGRTTEEKLFAVASMDAEKENGQKCEAWFYAGMKKLLAGDKTASEYFRRTMATEQKDFAEYQFAEAELKALAH
jgi:lipoprotein NlpI